MSLPLLKATIDSFHPTHMSDEDADNLELLLELPAFASLRDLVEEKIEAYWDWLRANPRCEFEKPKAKGKVAPKAAPKQQEAPKGLDPNRPIMWFQVDPKTGILTPVK
jgi:hypothetical protein